MTQGSGTLGRLRLAIVLAVLAVFGLALVWTSLNESSRAPSYPYSALLADAHAGKVTQINQDGLELTVWVVNSEAPRHTVFVASDAINVYAEVCAAAGTAPGPDCPILFSVSGESQSGRWIGLLITSLLPVLLIGSFIFFMMRAQQKKQ
jgi:ATP-dependent Zn protease